MQTVNGIHYETKQPIAVVVDNGIIKSITAFDNNHTERLPFIAPGLVDLQVNGYNGIDFNSNMLTTDAVAAISLQLLAQGVTTYYPTVITNSAENIQASLTAVAGACNESDVAKACIGGIHLEGPFISLQDGPVGAHDKQYVQAPNWSLFHDFNQAARNSIKIVTLSPEWPEAAAFTQRCVQQGIIVSIGHTAAGSDQIAGVAEAGASMSTHLGNGTHQVLPRHPNYIWDQLAEDKLHACFIGDGFHLPLAVIKVILKVKGHKAIMVSDSVSLAGKPAGNYTTPVGGEVVLTSDGRLHLAGKPGTLAGSAQSLLQGIQNMATQKLCSVADAWNLGSVNAAALMNLPQQKGLSEGAPADIVIFRSDEGYAIHIEETYKNGVRLYQAATSTIN